MQNSKKSGKRCTCVETHQLGLITIPHPLNSSLNSSRPLKASSCSKVVVILKSKQYTLIVFINAGRRYDDALAPRGECMWCFAPAHILAIYSEAAGAGFSAESGFCAMIR